MGTQIETKVRFNHPLAPQYPHNSPYAFSENDVVASVELEGLERVFYVDSKTQADKIRAALKSNNHKEVLRICHYGMTTPWVAASDFYVMNKTGRTLEEQRYGSGKYPTKVDEAVVTFVDAKWSEGKGEGHYSNGVTFDLTKMVMRYDNFEAINKDKLEGDLTMEEINSQAMQVYFEISYIFTQIGPETIEDVRESIRNGDNKQFYAIIVDGSLQDSEGLVGTYFHEIEAHLMDNLDVDGDGISTEQHIDHALYFAFYENQEYYESIGFTEAQLLAGRSPAKEQIVSGSPACETDTAIKTTNP